MEINDLLEEIKNWGLKEINITAVALVGSYARNQAKKDSDVDLMIICHNPDEYFSEQNWIHKFGNPKEIKNEKWSQLKTKRVFYESGLEVEFNFDTKSWANSEDPGTKRVIHDGMKILVDKGGVLSILQSNLK